MNDFFFESVAWQYKTAAVEDLWCLSTAEKFRSGPNVEISGHCWSDVCHRFKVWNMHELPRNSWNLKDKLYWKWKEAATFGVFMSCLLGPIHSLVRALLLDFSEIKKKTALLLIFQSSGLNIQGALVPIFWWCQIVSQPIEMSIKQKWHGIGRRVAKEFKPDPLMHSINLKCVCCVEHKCVQGMSPKSTVTQILPFAGKRRRKACDQKDLRLDNDHQMVNDDQWEMQKPKT